jgi:phytoene dehydrogenase-like protein
MPDYDAIVVGAGPNGLSAAVELARNGCSVLVIEANDTLGGGVRSGELTLPGFVHDICSTALPMGPGSPAFNRLPLHEHGLEWIEPELPLAHPLDGGRAALMCKSVEETAEGIGVDGDSYRRLMGPLVENLDDLTTQLLSPLRFPSSPFLMARFGLQAMRSVTGLANARFKTEETRALFAGIGAHSFLALEQPVSAAFGLVLAIFGHRYNWPFARGGSQKLSDAMASYFQSLGGEIRTGWRVRSLDELPSARAILFNLTPRQILDIAGHTFSTLYRRRLQRYRYGPGVFKLDWALDGPVPWIAEDVKRAGTVHLGGTLEEISLSESQIKRGFHPEQPFVLLTQPSLFDPDRAPEGKQTLWAYCHVPNGSTVDMTDRIEDQIERHAPGFKNIILKRVVRYTLDVEASNANYIGGDIIGGAQDIWQLFTRPTASWTPYRTSAKGIYICSSSTPPGGGVHGMSGYHAAQAALADM